MKRYGLTSMVVIGMSVSGAAHAANRGPIRAKMKTKIQPAELTSRYESALAAYASSDYRTAFYELSELFKLEPGNADLNFATGLAAVGLQKYSHAVMAFERVVALQPNNDRARLELARTYAAMGQFALAEEFFRQVLEHAPPEPVRRNIKKYLDELQTAQRTWRVTVQAGTGTFFDDNVNLGPVGKFIDIAPTRFGLTELDQLEVGADSRPQEDFGWFGLAGVSGVYDPGFKGRWMILGGASAYRTWLNEEHDYEINYLRAYTGVRHSGPEHLFETRFKVDYLERGHDAFSTTYGATPLYIRAVSDRVQSITRGAVEYRDYDRADDLDAAYVEVSQGVAVGDVAGGWTTSVTLAGFYNDAEAGEFSYAGTRLFGVATRSLPWKVTFQAAAGYRYSDYRRQEALATTPRDDGEWTVGLRLNRPITDQANLALSYSHTRNRSSFDLYDFDRNVLNLSLDYSF